MIAIRLERPGDAEGVYGVVAAAFGQEDEARIVDALRASGRLTVALVATHGDRVVGHVAFSPVEIRSSAGTWHAIALGPLTVAPAHQRRGVGARLVEAGLSACRAAGHGVVIVLGHSRYYPRFGFVPASRYGVRFEKTVPDDVFMLLELRPNAVAGREGVVRYGPEFRGDESSAPEPAEGRRAVAPAFQDDDPRAVDDGEEQVGGPA